MTNVHRHNAPRGTLRAPMVTIDHNEALQLHRAQTEAFNKSTAGAVWAAGVMLFGWLVVAGLPAWIVGAVNDSVAAAWWTFGGITAALVVAIVLLMRSS